MLSALQSLFTSKNCKILQAAVEEARELAMNHLERIGVLAKENEDLKDRIADECNAVTLLIDKLETEKIKRKHFAIALSDALSLSTNLRGTTEKTTNAVLQKKIANDRLAFEAIQRVLDSMQKDDA